MDDRSIKIEATSVTPWPLVNSTKHKSYKKWSNRIKERQTKSFSTPNMDWGIGGDSWKDLFIERVVRGRDTTRLTPSWRIEPLLHAFLPKSSFRQLCWWYFLWSPVFSPEFFRWRIIHKAIRKGEKQLVYKSNYQTPTIWANHTVHLITQYLLNITGRLRP